MFSENILRALFAARTVRGIIIKRGFYMTQKEERSRQVVVYVKEKIKKIFCRYRIDKIRSENEKETDCNNFSGVSYVCYDRSIVCMRGRAKKANREYKVFRAKREKTA